MLGHSGEECIKQKRLLLCLVTTRGWRRKDILRELKQRLADNFIQEWNATTGDKDRYFPHRSVKSVFEPEQYLSALEIYCFKVGLCQLRLGVLPINNNLHRYSNCAIQRNLCSLCKCDRERTALVVRLSPL